tara:strand:- start:351 stop:725 length:375 start_codon:yes stop_codon:yes gene_type:complete
MTSTWGRAGGPATQQVREYGDITMAAVANTNNATEEILAAPGADKYYLIWGATAACTVSSLGYIEAISGGEDILAFVVTKEGPMSVMFDLPVKVDTNVGVQSRTLATSLGTTLGAVYYTLHDIS